MWLAVAPLEMPGPDLYQKLCSLAIFALFWLADSSLPGWTGCGLGRRPLSWPRQKMAKWQTGSRTANLCQRPGRVKCQQSAGIWFPALPAHSFRYHASCHDMLHVILALLLKPRFSAGTSGCLAMHIFGLQRLFHSREGAWHKDSCIKAHHNQWELTKPGNLHGLWAAQKWSFQVALILLNLFQATSLAQSPPNFVWEQHQPLGLLALTLRGPSESGQF